MQVKLINSNNEMKPLCTFPLSLPRTGAASMRSAWRGVRRKGSEGGLQIWPELHAFSQQQSEGIPDRKLREAASDSNN